MPLVAPLFQSVATLPAWASLFMSEPVEKAT